MREYAPSQNLVGLSDYFLESQATLTSRASRAFLILEHWCVWMLTPLVRVM